MRCFFKTSKIESETSTREIKAFETKRLKGRKFGPQIIRVMKTVDKGNAIQVFDKVEYSNKLADMIGYGGCCKVKKGPTWRRKKAVSDP